LSIHAYIARSEYEAVVEERQKRIEAGESSSKKANWADKAQQAMPGPKASMKGGPFGSKEKGKALAYKSLQENQANLTRFSDLDRS
jgi:hypothetical protein